MKKALIFLAFSAELTFGLDNSITIHNVSGFSFSSRPVSVLMAFMRGEFPDGIYPRPRIGGEPAESWQVNVMSRWPDGSVMTAFVSFTVSLPESGSVVVDFIGSSSPCHLGAEPTCESAGLSQSEMLSMSWDAIIRGTANSITYSANARAMIEAGAWRYWYRGPLVTRVIVEDMSHDLAYDFGWQWDGSAWQAPTDDNYRSAHPIFDLAFWPSQGLVEVGWYLENPWRTRAQTLRFNLEMVGPSGAVVYSKTDYALGWRGGVSYYAWQPQTPPTIWIDRNLPYLVATKIFPSYDLSLSVVPSNVTTLLNNWNSYTGVDDQGRRDPRSCTSSGICGYIVTYMPQTGDHLDFGIIPGPHITYLYAMGSTELSVAQKLEAYEKLILGSGDAAVTIPIHTRESYTNMSPASRNYLMWPDDTTTPSFGRIFSVIAQPDGRALGFENTGSYPVVYRCPSGCPTDWHPWSVDLAHHPSVYAMPYLLSGRYAYLTTLQQAAASLIGAFHPQYERQYSFGIIPATRSNTEREGARVLKVVAWAYLLSPDGPERNYFAKILRNTDQFYEGLFGVGTDDASNCAGPYQTMGTMTISTSSVGTWPVTGSQKAFKLNFQGTAFGAQSIGSLTVDGQVTPVGIYGQGGSEEWRLVRGTQLLLYTGNNPPVSSITVSNIQFYRHNRPYCVGVAMRDGLENPIRMLGGGAQVSDLNNATSKLGGSPWMTNYFYMHWGWLVESEALAGFGQYTGPAIVQRWTMGMKAPWAPLIYEKLYRSARASVNGLIQSWSEYLSVHSPPAYLSGSVDPSSTSVTISCNPCPATLEPGSYIQIGNEWMEVSSHSGTTVSIARRGLWGTTPSSHPVGSPVFMVHTRLGGQTGHTYSNILHNAVASYPLAREAWERMVPLFTADQATRNIDLRYVLVPRGRASPTNVRVIVSGFSAKVFYNAPDFRRCRIAVDPADSSDGGDQEDDGGSLARRLVLAGMQPGMHTLRVTCGNGREIVRFSID